MASSHLPWDIPPSWAPALEAARDGAALLLVGGTDSGKSTLAAVLAAAAAEAGRVTAIVDADIGQSSVGPPTCVGMARLRGPITSFDDLSADAIDFVGSSSPVGHLLGAVASAHAMATAARGLGAETLVIDTTGLVSGSAARALKSAKIRLLAPDIVIAIQAEDEVEHLLTPYGHRSTPRIMRLSRSRRVKERTRDDRAARRQRKLAACFAGARRLDLSWDQAPLENTSWTTGKPAPGHIRAFAEERAGCEVLHAEVRADGLLLIVDGRPDADGLRALGANFGGSARAIDARVLDHLLVGLLGERGDTLGLGLIEAIDFRARRFALFTSVANQEAVRGIRLGAIRVARDGAELGWNDPGDVG